MRTIRNILFARDERELFDRVQYLVDIAYPLASDRLTPDGTGVDNDDPHRKVLKDLAHSREGIVYHRLALAVETLTALRDAVATQADPGYWPAQTAAGTMNPTEGGIAAVLVVERTRQATQVQEALDVATQALEGLSVTDNARWWAQQEREA